MHHDRSGQRGLVQFACDIVQQTSLVWSFLSEMLEMLFDAWKNSPMYLVLLNAKISTCYSVTVYYIAFIYIYIYLYIYIYIYTVYTYYSKIYIYIYRFTHDIRFTYRYSIIYIYILFMISDILSIYFCFSHSKIFQNTI